MIASKSNVVVSQQKDLISEFRPEYINETPEKASYVSPLHRVPNTEQENLVIEDLLFVMMVFSTWS